MPDVNKLFLKHQQADIPQGRLKSELFVTCCYKNSLARTERKYNQICLAVNK